MQWNKYSVECKRRGVWSRKGWSMLHRELSEAPILYWIRQHIRPGMCLDLDIGVQRVTDMVIPDSFESAEGIY